MKRGVLIVIVLILLTFGFFLGTVPKQESGQPATILSDKTNVNKGDTDEKSETDRLVFGAELSADRLLSPTG